MTTPRIEQLIELYHLTPHPEGGYYSEQFRSDLALISPVNQANRSALTHIYFLLTQGQYSRWHKVLHDEIWNVYEGAPLRILEFDGKQLSDNLIGSTIVDSASVAGDNTIRHYYKVIHGGHYQAAESTGAYTFIGCSVAPGFDFADFSYIEDEFTKTDISERGHDYAKFL